MLAFVAAQVLSLVMACGSSLLQCFGLSLQWLVSKPSLHESSWIRDPIGVPCIAGQILNHSTIREVLGNYLVTSLLSMLLLLESVFYFFKIYLVSSFWLCWLFIAVRGLSVVVESGSLLWLQLSVIAESGFLPWLWFFSFSLQWILLLQGMGP